MVGHSGRPTNDEAGHVSLTRCVIGRSKATGAAAGPREGQKLRRGRLPRTHLHPACPPRSAPLSNQVAMGKRSLLSKGTERPAGRPRARRLPALGEAAKVSEAAERRAAHRRAGAASRQVVADNDQERQSASASYGHRALADALLLAWTLVGGGGGADQQLPSAALLTAPPGVCPSQEEQQLLLHPDTWPPPPPAPAVECRPLPRGWRPPPRELPPHTQKEAAASPSHLRRSLYHRLRAPAIIIRIPLMPL